MVDEENTGADAIEIYIAGPDVFRPDAAAYACALQTYATGLGARILWPLDNEVRGADKNEVSRLIFEANCGMIRRADAVVANLGPFRGLEPDSGTAFEVGAAWALGKAVIAWSEHADVTYIERVGAAGELHFTSGCDRRGWQVEDFGLPFNLMLYFGGGGERVARGPREAIERAVQAVRIGCRAALASMPCET